MKREKWKERRGGWVEARGIVSLDRSWAETNELHYWKSGI